MYKKITYSLIILLSFFVISNVDAKEKTNLYIFYGETCPYCEEEITYLKKIEKKYKNIKFNYIEVWEHKDNEKLLEQVKEEYRTGKRTAAFLGKHLSEETKEKLRLCNKKTCKNILQATI